MEVPKTGGKHPILAVQMSILTKMKSIALARLNLLLNVIIRTDLYVIPSPGRRHSSRNLLDGIWRSMPVEMDTPVLCGQRSVSIPRSSLVHWLRPSPQAGLPRGSGGDTSSRSSQVHLRLQCRHPKSSLQIALSSSTPLSASFKLFQSRFATSMRVHLLICPLSFVIL